MSELNKKYTTKIEDFEKSIINYFIESGKLKRLSDKYSTIWAYLNIREKLTQEELIKLTNFSAGTVSKSLKKLIGYGILKKTSHPTSRKKQYEMIQVLSQMSGQFKAVIDNYTNGLDSLLKNINTNLEEINDKLDKIKGINDEVYEINLAKRNIPEKLDNIKQFSNEFTEILPKLKTLASSIEEMVRSDGKKSNIHSKPKDMSNLIPIALNKIDSKLDDLKNEIVNQYIRINLAMGTDEIKTKVLINFYIKRELTQKELRELTGYSAGKISEVLEELIDSGLITEEIPEGRGPYIYTIKDFQKSLFMSIKKSTEIYLHYSEEFKKIKEEINKFPVTIVENEVLKGIQNFLDKYFRMLPVYEMLQNSI
jgi:DNA-binding transcriptional regulator GbsR (MarR family)